MFWPFEMQPMKAILMKSIHILNVIESVPITPNADMIAARIWCLSLIVMNNMRLSIATSVLLV